jgi:DNA-binding FadR family transcriptional regulator
VLVLSHNPFILKCGNELQLQVKLARAKSGSEPARARSAHDEHRRIADSIANGDSNGARETMREHLRHSLDHACQIVNSLTGA